MENKDVKEKVEAIAKPIEQNYQSLIQQLRERKAVGVVVAVNGRIIWSDIFASTELLEKYWPKLVRSYASEAVVVRAKSTEVSLPRPRHSWRIWKAGGKRLRANREFFVRRRSAGMGSKRSR